MTFSRKKHRSQTKVKVVFEALKGERTITKITGKYGIHATQINHWKKAVLAITLGRNTQTAPILGQYPRRFKTRDQ